MNFIKHFRINKVCLIILILSSVLLSTHAQPPDSSILLDAVQVEAYQVSGHLRTIPGSLSVLSGEAIGLADGTNLAGTLNTLPGVTMQSGTYTTNRIVIRGMGSRTPYNTNRIRVYLNDIPFTGSDGISTPEEIDLHSLGRIELVKGPSSALNGSGLGGSINLYTPVQSQSEGSIGAQYGSYGTGKADLSGTLFNGKSTLWGSLGHLQSDGYRENNHYRRTSWLSAARWDHPAWSLNFTLLLMGVNGGIPSSLDKTMFENDPQAAAPSWKAIDGYKKYLKSVAGITLTNNLSGRLTSRITVFGRWHDSYEKRPFNNLDDRSMSAGVRNKVVLHGLKADWVLGAEWLAEQYDWKLDKADIRLNENREKRNQLNVFAMVYYRPVPKLNISIATALNKISYRLTDLYVNNGNQSGRRSFPVIVSPRIGVNYSPVNLWAVYASAGHGFSAPSPEETLLPAGDVNPEIKPEQGMQYELGARLNILHGKVQLDAALYWIEVNNLLVTKRITGDIFTGINAGRTRHQGLELQLQNLLFGYGSFPGTLRSVLSYTSSLNRFIDFTDDGIIYDGNKLPGIPDQTVYLQFTWCPLKAFDMIVEMYHAGDQYLTDGNEVKYPGYFLSNMKVTTRLYLKKAGRINLYAGIINLTNTSYASMLIVNAQAPGNSEPRYYYPGLPRNGYAGIQYIF